MTIEELNKLIKEELSAFFEAEDDDVDAGDDIEVTTDEPAVEDGDEALDTLRQIFNMLKPLVEPEEEEVEDIEDEETEDEEIADGEDDDEGLDEGIINESILTDLFEPTIRGMMDGDKIKLAIDNVRVAKIAAGLVFTLALSMGIDSRDSIKASLEAAAKNAKGIFAKFIARILGDEALLNALEDVDGKIDVDEAVDNHTFFRGDNANRVRPEAKDVQGRREKVNESVEKVTEETSNDLTDRFQKLANIQK